MNTIYIPLDSGESAVLKDPDTLLPRKIYEQLAQFIEKAVKDVDEVPKNSESFNETRSHKAISIDGKRGTGKTSVLVNLKSYLKNNAEELSDKIHILDPIDPTLLEDGESLFLHIIVAAVLQDKDIKAAQCREINKSRTFTQTLEELANGLESVDLQQSQRGMDKIRSLYGSKHLANCVEAFLKSALDLVGKKILILPIDDVDTSLNRAFENLEILRRYLTSPYVLPIVSGDRRLYDEVCWRDFHGRLNKDSSYERKKSYEIAKELAIEYQRKILPLPRRLSMPAVSDYWQHDGIDVTLNKDGIPLRNFMAWLKIFITGPVNGLEGSDLPLPVPSIRALTQFINHCSDLIRELPEPFKKKTSMLSIRRMWQMPDVSVDIIDSFAAEHRELSKEAKREYGEAYRLFYDELKKSNTLDSKAYLEEEKKSAWVDKLCEYFRFEPEAGAVFLTLQAKRYWSSWHRGENRNQSVLATPIFQPLQHEQHEYEIFESNENLSDWEFQLRARLPESWLTDIKRQKTLLPYPVAEMGINTSLNWRYWEDVHTRYRDNGSDIESKAIFLISALTQRNFYTNAKQSIVLNIGRVFEIIITSLISDIELTDLQRITQRAPFYSASALAPTKTLYLDDYYSRKNSRAISRLDSERELTEDLLEEVPDNNEWIFKKLCDDINQWRKDNDTASMNISPWLVYKVFNKVYSQDSSGLNNSDYMGSALNIASWVFYSTWSAFGSFEKGELFGLPDVVSTTNINSTQDFYKSDNFRINVAPFTLGQNQQSDTERTTHQYRNSYGEKTRTVSYMLATHPLKTWIDEINLINKNANQSLFEIKTTTQKKSVKDISPAREFITSALSLDPLERLDKKRIKLQMKKYFPSRELATVLINAATQQFPETDPAVKTLLAAFEELYPKGDK